MSGIDILMTPSGSGCVTPKDSLIAHLIERKARGIPTYEPISPVPKWNIVDDPYKTAIATTTLPVLTYAGEEERNGKRIDKDVQRVKAMMTELRVLEDRIFGRVSVTNRIGTFGQDYPELGMAIAELITNHIIYTRVSGIPKVGMIGLGAWDGKSVNRPGSKISFGDGVGELMEEQISIEPPIFRFHWQCETMLAAALSNVYQHWSKNGQTNPYDDLEGVAIRDLLAQAAYLMGAYGGWNKGSVKFEGKIDSIIASLEKYLPLPFSLGYSATLLSAGELKQNEFQNFTRSIIVLNLVLGLSAEICGGMSRNYELHRKAGAYWQVKDMARYYLTSPISLGGGGSVMAPLPLSNRGFSGGPMVCAVDPNGVSIYKNCSKWEISPTAIEVIFGRIKVADLGVQEVQLLRPIVRKDGFTSHMREDREEYILVNLELADGTAEVSAPGFYMLYLSDGDMCGPDQIPVGNGLYSLRASMISYSGMSEVGRDISGQSVDDRIEAMARRNVTPTPPPTQSPSERVAEAKAAAQHAVESVQEIVISPEAKK